MDSKEFRQMSIDNAKAALMQSWNSDMNNKKNKMITIKNKDKLKLRYFTASDGGVYYITQVMEEVDAYYIELGTFGNKIEAYKLYRESNLGEYLLLRMSGSNQSVEKWLKLADINNMNNLFQSIIELKNEWIKKYKQ